MKYIYSILIILTVSICVQLINVFPWWTFLIPCFILGVILPFYEWKVSSFVSGVASGFLVWFFSMMYFEMYYDGEIMQRTAEIIGFSYVVILLISGLIGGILTGLSVYSGFLLKRGKVELILEK